MQEMRRKDYMAMKIRTVKYTLREGMLNIYRNKLMSFASFSTVMSALLVFGMFYAVIFNLNLYIERFKQQAHIYITCDEKITEEELNNVRGVLSADERIAKHEFISNEQAFDDLKLSLGEDSIVLEGLDASILRDKFAVELKDLSLSNEVIGELKSITGVYKVSYSQRSIDLISRISVFVKAGSGVLITVLLIIAILIVSNTIKITVFARRREIGIMKHVGATDWFIRWPFVVEGMVVGIASAAVSLIITGYIYRAAVNYVNKELLTVGTEMFRLAPVDDMGMRMVVFYSVLGVIVGGLGSMLSIKRHLET